VLLRDAVKKAKSAGQSDAVLERATSLLATAANEVLAAPGASELQWPTPKDRTKADAARVEILQSLSALARQRP